MIEPVHLGYRMACDPGKQDLERSSMHTYQHFFFIFIIKNMTDSGLLPGFYLDRTFSPIQLNMDVSPFPGFNDLKIDPVGFGAERDSFGFTPADLVKAGQNFMRYTLIDKFLNGLEGPSQRRGIDLIEGIIFIGLIEQIGLLKTVFIQLGVHPAALYHPGAIIFRFTMPNKKDFFHDQFFKFALKNILFISFANNNMINPEVTIENLNETSRNTLVEHLGIEYTEIGQDYLKARMPVDQRTHQPFGMLHGGASVALAESLGSLAANLMIDQEKFYCVGLEINANHVRIVRDGWVYGHASPLYLGKTTQVWEIKINNEREQLVSISRLTLAVIDKIQQNRV